MPVGTRIAVARTELDTTTRRELLRHRALLTGRTCTTCSTPVRHVRALRPPCRQQVEDPLPGVGVHDRCEVQVLLGQRKSESALRLMCLQPGGKRHEAGGSLCPCANRNTAAPDRSHSASASSDASADSSVGMTVNSTLSPAR